MTLTGDDNDVSGATGGSATITVSGVDEIFNLDNSSINLILQNSTGNQFAGDDDTIGLASGDAADIQATGAVNASDATIEVGASSSDFTVYGASDTIGDASGVSGGTVGLTGSADALALSGAQVYLDAANYTETVSGSQDTFYSSYSGDTLTLSGQNDVSDLTGATRREQYGQYQGARWLGFGERGRSSSERRSRLRLCKNAFRRSQGDQGEILYSGDVGNATAHLALGSTRRPHEASKQDED
jgi:hypothetical protein